MKRETVVVAMSGGVDSSVAAALLVEAGYRVIGLMLRLWSEDGSESLNRCCTPDAMALARKVAGQLDIPFYPLDVQQPFHDTIVTYFLDGYNRGVTPNPCLVCNRQIRWGLMRDHALSMGADFLATGHYARVLSGEGQAKRLARGADRLKDQSYILSGLKQEQLAMTLFPVGGYTKPEVRSLADCFDLPVADRAESQDLCFITSGDYRDFLARHSEAPAAEGAIVNSLGSRIGTHRGLSNYTIGQRKGLGVSSPVPLYVIDKRRQENILVVGEKDELGRRTLTAHEANWISPVPPTEPFRACVQVRYRARETPARVTPIGHTAFSVDFDELVLDITPGQLAVIYDGDTCVGSGLIHGGLD